MQIWYMEPYPIGDRRMPHHLFPPKVISPDQLQQAAGVVSYKVIFNSLFTPFGLLLITLNPFTD